MAKPTSVISLDAIDRKKKLGAVGRFLITRRYGGRPVVRSEPFGHYMFCGTQGFGKTASVLWYAEKLQKKYTKKGFDVKLYSNIEVGNDISRDTLFSTIDSFNPDDNVVHIVIIDEIQTYFPKDNLNREIRQLTADLQAIFGQLRKRKTFILSTAQIYGRLDKSLREQCLYMVDCHLNFTKTKLVNEFIPQDDILCDDLGRWSGKPKKIYIHGLSKMVYNTKRIIRT